MRPQADGRETKLSFTYKARFCYQRPPDRAPVAIGHPRPAEET